MYQGSFGPDVGSTDQLIFLIDLITQNLEYALNHSGHTSWKSWKSWNLAICPGMSLNVLENGFDLAFVLEMSWNSSLSGLTKISFDKGF